MLPMSNQGFAKLYLIVGVVSVSLFVVVKPGVYKGRFHGTITVLDTEVCETLRVRAETRPRWYWAKPGNHQYRHATVDSISRADSATSFDLAAGTWRSSLTEGTSDRDGLVHLVMPDSGAAVPSPDCQRQIDAVQELLHSLRDGTAPRPRHHTHYVESPIRASYTHFTPGRNYGFFVLCAYLAVWPICLLLLRGRSGPGAFRPFISYLLSIAVVGALDATFILIAMNFSPGPVAEFMEFMIAMTNFPAWVIFGDRLVLSLPGYIMGALLWATLVSMVVFAKRDTAVHGKCV